MKKYLLNLTAAIGISQSLALAAPGPHNAPIAPIRVQAGGAREVAVARGRSRLSPLTVPRSATIIMKRLEQIEASLMKPENRPDKEQKKSLDSELTALTWAVEKIASGKKPDQKLRALHSYAFYVRGVLHFEMKDMASSMRFLDCALKDDAKNAKAYEQRGTVFVLSGKPIEALRDFDNAIKNGLEGDFALINRGSMYVTTGQNDKAIEDLTLAAVKRTGSPDEWMPLMLRAKAYAGLKKYPAARQDATSVLALASTPKSLQGEMQRFIEAIDAKANENAAPPPDKPFQAERTSLDALIAPYVEAARKTLPSAKERYLKGLPPKEWMSVTTRIYGSDSDPGAIKPMEQVFVTVKSWSGDSISGALASPVHLPNHSQGEPITVAEKDVLDWTIVRADGSEDGNVVGKFMESAEARASLAARKVVPPVTQNTLSFPNAPASQNAPAAPFVPKTPVVSPAFTQNPPLPGEILGVPSSMTPSINPIVDEPKTLLPAH